MAKLLRFFLVLAFVSGVTTPLSKLGTHPIALVGIIINIALVVLAWRGLTYTLNNTEQQNNGRKARIIRWLMLSYFSVVAVGIGVLVAFISRLFLDSVIVDAIDTGHQWAIFASKSGLYGNLSLLIFPLLISLPILYLLGRALGFTRPLATSVTIFLLWQLLLHLPKLLGI